MADAIKIGDADIPEVIINYKDNFKSKIEYYKSTYDENMVHKMSKDIKIAYQDLYLQTILT